MPSLREVLYNMLEYYVLSHVQPFAQMHVAQYHHCAGARYRVLFNFACTEIRRSSVIYELNTILSSF